MKNMTVETLIYLLQKMNPASVVAIETVNGDREVLGQGKDVVDGNEYVTTIYTKRSWRDVVEEFDLWWENI